MMITLNLKNNYKFSEKILNACWSPDGNKILLTIEKKEPVVVFLNSRTNKIIKISKKHYKLCKWNRNRIILAHAEDNNKEICVINAHTLRILSCFNTKREIIAIDLTKHLFVCSKEGSLYIRLQKYSNPGIINKLNWETDIQADFINYISISSFEDRIALCGNNAWIISGISGTILYRISQITSYCFWSPGSTRLITMHENDKTCVRSMFLLRTEFKLDKADMGFYFVNSEWIILIDKNGNLKIIDIKTQIVLFEKWVGYSIKNVLISKSNYSLLIINNKGELHIYNFNFDNGNYINRYRNYRTFLREKYGNRNVLQSNAPEIVVVQNNTLLELINVFEQYGWEKALFFTISDLHTDHADIVQDWGGVKRHVVSCAIDQAISEKYLLKSQTSPSEFSLNEIEFLNYKAIIPELSIFFEKLGKFMARIIFLEECPVGSIPNLALKLAMLGIRFDNIDSALAYLKKNNIDLYKRYSSLIEYKIEELKDVLGFDEDFTNFQGLNSVESILLYCIQGGILYKSFSRGFRCIELNIPDENILNLYTNGVKINAEIIAELITWKNTYSIIEVWFKSWLNQLDESKLLELLRFWTGHRWISQDTKLIIRVINCGDNYVPTAKTCFNELTLSNYSNKDMLIYKCVQALEYGGNNSFGLD